MKENVKIAKKEKKPKEKHFDQPDSFDSISDDTYQMESEGLSVGFNMPPAISSKDDVLHSLPPYRRRKFYSVDEFPGCPRNWVPSQGKMRSYFVPVIEGEGMWLDFNMNRNNAYEVAVVVSVQGINAITGMMTSDEHLEQYIEKCPKHDEKFGPNRWCEKCGFHWPKQNYICTNATPKGQFWLDGFRAADGAVRQYLLTAEKMRGVASNLIGEERVHAIGLSFFLSKNKKPEPVYSPLRARSIINDGYYGDCFGTGLKKYGGETPNWNYYSDSTTTGTSFHLMGMPLSKGFSSGSTQEDKTEYTLCANNAGGASCHCSGLVDSGNVAAQEAGIYPRGLGEIKATKLEIGAGAKIRQQIFDDPENLDFWREDPSAIICVNYVLEKEARDIFTRGKLDLSGSQEGFLQGIPVGN